MIHGGDIYNNHVFMDASVNINPLGVPAFVRRKLQEDDSWLTQYPDPSSLQLKKDIASVLHLDYSRILPGNGASEIIMCIFQTLRPMQAVVTAPGFYGYIHGAAAVDCRLRYYGLKEENSFRLTEDFLSFMTEEDDLLILTNPNNPTGQETDEGLLEKILKKAKECNITVVVDECFRDLRGKEALTDAECKRLSRLIDSYDNLIMIRAFTKTYAMPGLRLGYAIAGSDLVGQMSPLLPEWNISGIAQTAAAALLAEDKREELQRYLRQTEECIRRERKFLQEKLQELSEAYPNAGLVIFESRSDFILIKCRIDLYKEMLAQGILIRDCSNYRGLSKGFYRIAVQDHGKNEKLLAATKAVFAQLEYEK